MNLSRGRRVRERREEREERERKVEWVVVLLGVLVIMMGYLAMKGRGGGGRREDTEGLSQQVQLHLQPYRFDYIKYPRNIDNITQFNQEIKEQIDNVLTDYSLKDIQLISLLSNKVQDIYQTESLRGLSKKVEEYQNLQQILRNKYEDSTSIQNTIHSEISLYNTCRDEITTIVYSLKGQKLPFDISKDIKATQEQLTQNSNTLIQQGEKIDKIHEEYKPLIQKLEQMVATNQIKKKNLSFNEQQIRESEMKNQKIIEQIEKMKGKLPQMGISKVKIDRAFKNNEAKILEIQIELENLEESIFYLKLQIEEKKMSINLPRILKDLNVHSKQEFATQVKERLMVLQQMYSHEIVNKQQQKQLEAEITKLQNKYQEIMELLNQLKQKAFKQYQNGYKNQILEKESELNTLISQKELLTDKIGSLENQNVLLMDELVVIKKNEADYNLRIDQLMIEKEQNDIRLSQVDDQPEEIAHQQKVLTSQLESLNEKQAALIKEKKEKMRQLSEREEVLMKQRESQVSQHRNMRFNVMEFTRGLNKKIYECQTRLKYLSSVIANGKNYLQEVNRFYTTLTELDQEITQMLLLNQQNE